MKMDISQRLVIIFTLFFQVTSMEPLVLWTQKSHAWSKIRGVTGNPDTWIPQRYKPYVQSESVKNTFKFGLTYNPATHEVLWSDIYGHNIYKQDLNSSLNRKMDNVQEIFKQDGLEFSALAVDWLANSLYFIERTGKYIGVMSSKNSSNKLYKVLFKSTVQMPTSLSVDPYKGLLFWSDQQKGTIEVSTTSGSNQKTIVSGLWKPLGITLDIEAETIYYLDADANTINKVKYDGTGKVELYKSATTKAYFEIALQKNYIFITTGANLQVDIHKKTGEHVLTSDIDAGIYHIISPREYQIPPHECQSKPCEHICINLGDGNRGQCTCASGYTLQTDGLSCAETSPSYVMIKNNSVLLSEALIDEANLNQMTVSNKVIKQDALQARAVGVHYEMSNIFYSDVSTDMIYRGDKSGSFWREITAGTRQVEGIAIDWIGDNLYWSDKVLQHIMCSHLTGHFHKLLIENLLEPKDLAIDSINKRLVWTSNHLGTPRIETVGLDGVGRKLLVDGGNVGVFVGITLDPATKRIYWSDRGKGIIESVNLDGQDKQTVMGTQQFDMYGVAVYGDYLTYTKESAYSSNFFNMKQSKEISSVINDWTSGSFVDTKKGYYDLALFDSYAQPKEASVCQTNNGDCSQLCFPSMSSHSCGCAIGYTLNGDGQTCDSNIAYDHFLLFVDPYHKQIYQVQSSLQATAQGMPVSRMEFPIGMDFDIAERKVYWIDKDTRQIKSSYLDGSEDRVVYNLPQASKEKKIAIDPVSRCVFYTDEMDKALHRIDITSGEHEVFESNIQSPFGVVVDYDNGLVYWTNGGTIERTTVKKGDGIRETVFMNSNLQLTGLTFIAGMLYTGDWKSGDIYYVDTNTSSLTSNKLTNVGKELYSLAADTNYLYFTNWNEKGVYRINRLDGTDKTLLYRDVFARITDLKAVESLLPVPAMVVPPPGDNTIVIAGAAAGAAFLLILLALLFGILAARSCKKSSKSSDTTEGSSGFENGDRDAEYMMYANGAVFDNRSSNRNAPNLSPKDSLSNDSGVSEMSARSTADLINGSPDLGNSNNNVGEYNNAFNEDPITPQNESPSNAPNVQNGPSMTNGEPVLTVLAPPLSKRYAKKAKASRKTMKKRESSVRNDFNLREDKKVATVIQRLATRLRKRLSSVRYDEPSPRPGINTDPSDVNIEIDGVVDPLRLYPEKKKMPPNKRMIHIPNKLHKEPRGWAPASHNVPRQVINTLGKAKGQALSNYNGGADTGRKS